MICFWRCTRLPGGHILHQSRELPWRAEGSPWQGAAAGSHHPPCGSGALRRQGLSQEQRGRALHVQRQPTGSTWCGRQAETEAQTGGPQSLWPVGCIQMQLLRSEKAAQTLGSGEIRNRGVTHRTKVGGGCHGHRCAQLLEQLPRLREEVASLRRVQASEREIDASYHRVERTDRQPCLGARPGEGGKQSPDLTRG